MEASIQEIANYTCPICLSLTIEPVRTECNHLFCKYCLEEVMENSTNEEDFKCPMCRAVFDQFFTPNVDKNLDSNLLKIFPKEYALRKKLLDEYQSIQYEKFRILYGNTHVEVVDPKQSRSNEQCVNKHKWSCFVRVAGVPDSSTIIKKVSFGMHPTFGCTEVVVTKNPYQINRLGWGTFEIPIKIYFHKIKEPVELTHNLSFESDGQTKVYILKVKKE